MAIATGDRVAMTVNIGATPTLLGLAGVPPMFGTVAAAGLNILWRNGSFSTAVPSVALDKIEDADAAVANEFVGKRVKVTTPTGFSNWGLCTCIDAYKRDHDDLGTTIQVLLLQNPSGEYYFEVLSANCEVVS